MKRKLLGGSRKDANAPERDSGAFVVSDCQTSPFED